MINKLFVLLILFSIPNILADCRNHFNPRSIHTENSSLNENTTLVFNKNRIYHKFVFFCLKNDAFKTPYITYNIQHPSLIYYTDNTVSIKILSSVLVKYELYHK